MRLVLEKRGKVMVMVRYIYVLHSSGADWRTVFMETLHDMYFVPAVPDPDVYHRQENTHNGGDYYELLLVYVYDKL